MLLGKMLRGLTGTPMRRIALANSSLALAEPEPLTLANLTTKSLVASRRVMVPGSSFRCHLHRDVDGSAGRLRHLHQELLHVPGPRRATLGAQAAVQADVFVLDHQARGLERRAGIQRLRRIARRRLQARAQRGLVARLDEADAVHRADVDAG